MKKVHLLTLALVGILIFGSVPMTVNAMSPNGQGGIVTDESQGAGDTVDIGDEDVPQAGGNTVDVENENVPLATLSGQAAGGFSWWGFWLGVCVGVVGEAVVVVVAKQAKSKDKGKN